MNRGSLKELLGWDLVQITHVLGDRRDFFTAQHDTWEVIRMIIEGRKRREIDPTLAALRECAAALKSDRETPEAVRERIIAQLEFREAPAAENSSQDDANGRTHREGPGRLTEHA